MRLRLTIREDGLDLIVLGEDGQPDTPLCDLDRHNDSFTAAETVLLALKARGVIADVEIVDTYKH